MDKLHLSYKAGILSIDLIDITNYCQTYSKEIKRY